MHRPWITEPGLWLQYDFADGPIVAGRKVVLLVAWLAWSRYRVVIALRDRTAPSVFAGLDRIFRIVGGAPTYLLTDNEKTVTTGHIAGVPVRNRAAVTFGRYYGISVLTCEPADPASKGGVENAVKLAKADIVPTETNLLPQYATFADVEAACSAFVAEINARVHRTTGRRPVEMLTSRTPRTARGARPAPHRRVGGDPPGPRQHPDGHLRALPILAAGNTIGPNRVDPSPRRHRRSGDLRPRRRRSDRGGAAPPRHPGQPRHRRQLISPSTATRFPVTTGSGPAPSPSRRSWPWARCGGVAQRSRRRRHRTDPAENGPRRGTVRAGRPRRRRLGARVMPPCTAASPPAISIPSSPARAWIPPAAAPARTPPWRKAPAGGTCSAATIIDAPRGGHRMNTTTTAAQLPADVETLMRALRLPHARAIAADVLATARAQRWDPTEVIKALLTEETAGRARSMLASRRKAAGFPTGKTFDVWDPGASSIPLPTQQALQTLEWVGRRENLVVCGPAGTGKTFFLEALGPESH